MEAPSSFWTTIGLVLLVEGGLAIAAAACVLIALRTSGPRRRNAARLAIAFIAVLLVGELWPRLLRKNDYAIVDNQRVTMTDAWKSINMDVRLPGDRKPAACAALLWGQALWWMDSEVEGLVMFRGSRLTRFEALDDPKGCECPFEATIQAYTIFGVPYRDKTVTRSDCP